METKSTKRLSPAQRRLMDAMAKYGSSCPPGGNRQAGRAASAWWRTFDSLRRMGLAQKAGACSAVLTDAGRDALSFFDLDLNV